jgi:serine/threonine protein kinase
MHDALRRQRSAVRQDDDLPSGQAPGKRQRQDLFWWRCAALLHCCIAHQQQQQKNLNLKRSASTWQQDGDRQCTDKRDNSKHEIETEADDADPDISVKRILRIHNKWAVEGMPDLLTGRAYKIIHSITAERNKRERSGSIERSSQSNINHRNDDDCDGNNNNNNNNNNNMKHDAEHDSKGWWRWLLRCWRTACLFGWPPLHPRRFNNNKNLLIAANGCMPARMARREWSWDQFTHRAIMHRGYAATVYSARCAISHIMVVVKRYPLDSLRSLHRAQLFRELVIHSSLNHPCIAQMYAAFLESRCVYIVMEFCGGITVRDYLNRLAAMGRPPHMSEEAAVDIVLFDLLSVLRYLHARHIIHKDIKPENIIIMSTHADDPAQQCVNHGNHGNDDDDDDDHGHHVPTSRASSSPAPFINHCNANMMTRKRHHRKNKIRLIDFGLSCMAGMELAQDPFAGTPPYLPSTVTGATLAAADVWAVGVMAFELLFGYLPFGREQFVRALRAGRLQLPRSVSQEAHDFLRRALAWDAHRRASAAELLQHTWIAGCHHHQKMALPSQPSSRAVMRNPRRGSAPSAIMEAGRI